jgi:hypothetical protein
LAMSVEGEETMRLGDLPEGVYRLEQRLDEDGEASSVLYPVRKRWWWFGRFPEDKDTLNLAYRMIALDRGEG